MKSLPHEERKRGRAMPDKSDLLASESNNEYIRVGD